MSKVISVKRILYGHYDLELDSGHKVTVARGEDVPQTGEEYDEKWGITGAVAHAKKV